MSEFELLTKPVAVCAQLLQEQCHGMARAQGWWTDLATGESQRMPYVDIMAGRKPHRNVGELLMLAVSELSEAMEGDRKRLMDDKLPNRPMLEVEMADAVIRIFDMSGAMDLDIAGAIAEKLAFNAKRADHTMDARRAAGGKAY